MASDIKKTVRDTSREPFSREERDAIIAAFENNSFCSKFAPIPHSYYAPYVKFLFITGCRPEEAIALQWKHISADCQRIQFKEAIPSDTGIRGQTKTGKTRIFPCNPKLQEFLQSINPKSPLPNDLVFPGSRGQVINSHNFLNRVWKPVVEGLVKAGKVEKYLPQYNIRHTFITINPLIKNKEAFATKVKNTRNYYTHYNQSLKNKIAQGDELFRLTQILSFLLQSCLLSELGCTPERCADLLSDNGEYQYTIEAVQRANFQW